MRISFCNSSDSNVTIAVSGQLICCSPKQTQVVMSEEGRINFEVSTNERSAIRTLSKIAGLTYKYDFITAASYESELSGDTRIVLYADKKDGKHLETYTRVIAVSETALLSAPRYRIKDEADIKKQIRTSLKRGSGVMGFLGVLNFLDDLVGWLCIAFLVALAVGVFIFAESTLIKVGVAIAAAIIIGIVFIISRVAAGFDKWIDKKLNKDKKEETVCISADVDLYKDEDSFFDADYISSVFSI